MRKKDFIDPSVRDLYLRCIRQGMTARGAAVATNVNRMQWSRLRANDADFDDACCKAEQDALAGVLTAARAQRMYSKIAKTAFKAGEYILMDKMLRGLSAIANSPAGAWGLDKVRTDTDPEQGAMTPDKLAAMLDNQERSE